jgi:hypothetical protein
MDTIKILCASKNTLKNNKIYDSKSNDNDNDNDKNIDSDDNNNIKIKNNKINNIMSNVDFNFILYYHMLYML